ncbi:conserved hypothetical protein (plasmid) [Sinorhizobium fredii HH103]|uniref:Putative transposase n=1 Tax=Sinorhizobium fredii (strain HH103) TaxID=1117943 RepID=G9AI89_SINF1|nr:putative transposase [Sinorhizobium fredii HH103]CCF00771.1 conserved hypothetical protein [Sinorhizobium fredii HH103]
MLAAQLRNGTTSSTALSTTKNSSPASKQNLRGSNRPVTFNARGPDGLVNGKAPGGRAKLNVAQRHALAKIVESGPIPAIHGVVRWRRKDLVRWIFQEFRIAMDETTVGRELKALGFAKLSARPRHYAQNELEAEAFKKTSPPLWRKSEAGSRAAPTSSSGGPTKRA